MRLLLLATAVCAVVGLATARADGVKIGVLTDMAGVTADITGRGSVEAARMAAADFGGSGTRRADPGRVRRSSA